jgi:dipeptidyl aminopeptidase/acylaminoacyl peptidase
LTYTVTRTGPTDVDSTITYNLGGSAEEGDYAQNGTGTLTFAAGATTASFMIDPISDTIFEFDETVIATLGTASDGGTITQGAATGTISNDDPISRVSVDSNELQAVGPGYNNPSSASYNSSISADGRYVTFVSSSPNLVAEDTNNIRDIFVRDLLLGTTTRVSVNSDEGEANTSGYTAQYSDSFAPSISADGRFVTFFSDANNLVPNDTNSANDVFVRDLQTGTTTRVSVNSDEEQSIQSGSYGPAISADGRFVAFYSGASDLVKYYSDSGILFAGDTNLTDDIFVRDLLLGTTERVSVSSDETPSEQR